MIASFVVLQKTDKITIYYEYSHENVSKFCADLDGSLASAYNSQLLNTFDEFLNVFQSSVDNTCKLSVPKTTKRNAITNPWITNGLINSINNID